MILDSLETIDVERIAALLEDFYTDNTSNLGALLPEDASAIDDYAFVRDI